MLVDDEMAILKLSEMALSSRGYTVVPFVNPESACLAFSEAKDSFDIVVTDLTMSGMTGLELGRAMHMLRPGLPLILTTGNPAAVNQKELDECGFCDVIKKPYSADEFSDRVHKNLNSAR
jgi:DNA-binding NtrC family response regulator